MHYSSKCVTLAHTWRWSKRVSGVLRILVGALHFANTRRGHVDSRHCWRFPAAPRGNALESASIVKPLAASNSVLAIIAVKQQRGDEWIASA